MLVKQAKAVARQWVLEEAIKISGFVGAFYHGSANWLPDQAELAPTSDLDIMVVLDVAEPTIKLGKLIYQNVLLEISYLAYDQVQSSELILGNYQLAGSFKTPGIIADPTGQLTVLQAAVAKAYAKRTWVEQRCQHAYNNVLRNLQALNAADLFHDQVTAWLFAAGVTTHVLLVAGLKNPTVRKRYVAVRELLAAYDQQNFYATLLDLLGCAQISPARVEQHLAALTAVFDATKTVIKTPFFFASDLSELARPIAIDGSRELIERGDYREAIFWIVATYSRCQKVLYHDAPPELQAHFSPGYCELVADLGITSFADLQQRSAQIEQCLPAVWAVAEAIMAANPELEA